MEMYLVVMKNGSVSLWQSEDDAFIFVKSASDDVVDVFEGCNIKCITDEFKEEVE